MIFPHIQLTVIASVIIIVVDTPSLPTETGIYQVNTNVYEGPLDLLLELIEKAELDITRLALAQVTNQYLAYLNQMQDREPGEVSAFLVVAAKLLQIKSSALLPHQESGQISQQDDEEDPAEALARQLIIYRKFKEISKWLDARQEAGLHSYLRVAPVPYKFDAKIDLSDVTLKDLVEAAAAVLLGNNQKFQNISTVVSFPRITIRDRIRTILNLLHNGKPLVFGAIPRERSRIEHVVSFLAMLELIKRNIIHAYQDNLFGDILIETTGSLDDNQEMEDEFND